MTLSVPVSGAAHQPRCRESEMSVHPFLKLACEGLIINTPFSALSKLVV